MTIFDDRLTKKRLCAAAAMSAAAACDDFNSICMPSPRRNRSGDLAGVSPRCHDRPMLRAVLLLACVSLFTALAASASDALAARSLTFRVYVTGATRSIKDVPPRTLSGFEYTKGDTIRGTESLRNAVRQFDKPTGAVVGADRYVILAVAYQKVRVDFVTSLPGGTVHAHGEGKPGSGKVPIVGGTGLYAGATGVAEGRHLADGRKLNVYRLRIP